MAYVKLDTQILDSTLWLARDQREVFITALLMAVPREFTGPCEQIKVDSLDPTGWQAPAGWYGFVPAAGIGIVNRAGLDRAAGMDALRVMGEPELDSRSKEHGGRRMIRIDGGFIVLNYMKYRDQDHTAAERQRRLRQRKKDLAAQNGHAVTLRDQRVTSRIADADADADAVSTKTKASPLAPAAPPDRAEKPHPVEPDGSRPVNPDAGGELALAHHLLEELGVNAADNGVRRAAAEAIRLLAKEGGTIKTAFDFILAAGLEAKAAGEILNRFWFQDEKFKPQVPRRNKKQRDREKAREAFLNAAEEK